MAAADAQGGSGPPPANAEVAPGFTLALAADGLDFPTSAAHDASQMWMSEAGFLPGMPARVLDVDTVTGTSTPLLSATGLPVGVFAGPLTSLTFRNGWLWLTHRTVDPTTGWLVGAISRLQPGDPVGTFETVISGLPSSGDHHTNSVVFDAAGRGYFGVGTATNSAVVGSDNGWLADHPGFRDFPPTPVMLSGIEYRTRLPIPQDPTVSLATGPFQPFGSGLVSPGQLVPAPTPSAPIDGIIAGNGTVCSFDADASQPVQSLTLEAWGLRNPFGLLVDASDPSTLWITNNGADIRLTEQMSALVISGARPIARDDDDLFELETGGNVEFFGWPDVFHDPDTGGPLPVTDPLFCHGFVVCPEPALQVGTLPPTEPAAAQLGRNVSANRLVNVTSPDFSHVGDLLIAESGAFVPVTGATHFNGYRVIAFDRTSGDQRNLVRNIGQTVAEIFAPDGFNKPIDDLFEGDTLWIVDFGGFEPGIDVVLPGTGKLWMLTAN